MSTFNKNSFAYEKRINKQLTKKEIEIKGDNQSMACLFSRETTIAVTVKYKLLQKLHSVQVFLKENGNNNRNNFKQMNKRISITKIPSGLIVGELIK